MKIIGLITEDYWHGGLARFNANLIKYWGDKNTKIIVFTNRKNLAIKKNADNPNLDIVYFNFTTVNSGVGKKQSLFSKAFKKTIFKYFFFIFRYFTLKRIFRRHNVDQWIISNGGYPGSDLCRLSLLVLKRQKGIFVFHGMVQKPRLFLNFIERLLDKIIFCKNKFDIVTVSHTNAQSVSQRPWIKSPEIKVIYNGIKQPAKIKNHNLSSGDRIVAMASGLRSYKGQRVVIQAAEYLKSEGFGLKVRFYGSDFRKFTVEIEEMIKNSLYPEIFSLPGFCPVDRIMDEADLVVVPSLVYESFGYTAAEAMAYGVPVIASDVGGLPEVIENAGVICKAGNVERWASAIKNILTNNKLRQVYIERGRKRSKDNFSIEDMVMNYKRLLIQK
ncbi:MAG: glycosyltransferase family 4 protein [Candidatus Omnitrophica bacterium]|nr:glycosyltransferase family 4 protein [Candidatus Omnitrophota bacterium]